MKSIYLLVAILLIHIVGNAQPAVEVISKPGGLFVEHIVKPKESLYSLARLYHTTPAAISSANKLKHNAALRIGQQVHIPLNAGNFIQTGRKDKRGLVPVYHTVKPGENLYRLSMKFNKISRDLLYEWNNIEGEKLTQGQRVVIGYLKADLQSGEEIARAVMHDTSKTDKPVAPDEQSNIAGEEKQSAKEDKKEKDVKREKEENAENNETIIKHEKPVEKSATLTTLTTQKEEATRTTTPVIATSSAAADNKSGNPVVADGSSYFERAYVSKSPSASERSITGIASIFKSTSGWSDKKYYVLMNDVPAETIVRLTANGRFIFAKVLDALPELRENSGLICRLSSAAASALGVEEAKFSIELHYFE